MFVVFYLWFFLLACLLSFLFLFWWCNGWGVWVSGMVCDGVGLACVLSFSLFGCVVV